VPGESSSRRAIRIPVEAIPSLAPEARGLTSAERERLRLVRPGSEAGPAPASAAAGGSAPGALNAPGADDDPDAPGDRLVVGVPFVLRGALRTALEPLGQRAQQKRIGFGWHVAPDVPEGVIGDGGRLAQLLVHVVGHAIRSTDQGEVRVSVRLGTLASSTVVLLGSVADSSAGLVVEDQRRLFEALGRDDDPVRTVSTAAGLAVAGRLVRGMAGQIWFESEPDHGTTVRFTMRLGVRTGTSHDTTDEAVGSARLPRRRPAASAGSGLDLLVVDDVSEDRVETARVLEQRGHHVVVASDGHEALGVAVATPFDVVLINLRMPRMDGFELAAVLRSLEGRRGRRLPIVALSTLLLAGDLERCAATGIDACLRKPIDGDGLIGAIAGLLANPRRHSVPESA
jgi:CheY-like chemotaxis protein